MKIKKEFIVLLVVIVSLSFYLYIRNTDQTHYQLPTIPDIASKEISKIEIIKKDTSIILEKKDTKWFIVPHEYPADSSKVNDILSSVEKLTLTTLVSESEDYDRYDLSDEKKITIKTWINDSMRQEFEIGKVAPSYQHTFVKLGNNNRIYHARGNLRSRFDQKMDDFRDKTVLSFDQSEILEVHLTKDEQSIVLTRKQSSSEVTINQEPDTSSPSKREALWQSSDGMKGDESGLSRLLNTLSNLRCERYLEDKKKDDFTNSVYTLHLKGLKDYTLTIFAHTHKEAKGFPAISSENDYPFIIPEWQAKNIMISPDEILTKSDES
ncbi:MAG: DUF4340 domain-containing protein [Thermodesulfobacteriota bacterium]|nr:DUF4340 domain-containing protein [Thermodesulfobacteriota bacterium]